MSTVRRLGVFCGARPGRSARYLEVARQVGTGLVAAGWELVYGGAREGCMGALADAVLSAGGRAHGVIPAGLCDETAHRGLTELHVVGTLHERKAHMEMLSDAFVALPGGHGTLDELFDMLTWGELGYHAKLTCLLNAYDYFDPLLHLLRHCEREGFASPQQRAKLVVAADAQRLFETINAAVAR